MIYIDIDIKPSAVGQLTRPTQPFILLGSVNELKSDGYYYSSQWRRRLVNAYEVNAGTVCLQCNNCVINT